MASGLLALRDAGIPLTPEEQIGKGGLRLIRNWQVRAPTETEQVSSLHPASLVCKWP